MNTNNLKRKSNGIMSLLIVLAMVASMLAVPVSAENNPTVVTVPNGAEVYVEKQSSSTHFQKLDVTPSSETVDGNNTKYEYNLEENGNYIYRVSGDGYVAYGGSFKNDADASITVTEDMLRPTGKTSATVEREASLNNGKNEANIYININTQGYLKLNTNDTFQIVPMRNLQIVNSFTNDYIIEPIFHYNVIDENGNPSDVAEVDKNGLLTAKKSGNAIVLVTYDAITVNYGTADFYSAIYPENTGVFVVSVDAEDSGIDTGMKINVGKNNSATKLAGDYIDSELDCIYYTGDNGEYTFVPTTDGVNVSVANPTVNEKMTFTGFETVDKNDDGSYTVPLKEGRNIVKLEKSGKAEYQIVTAKKVTVTVNAGEAVQKGDTLNIVFDRLYHPAQKVAGIYNMHATALYTNVSGYSDKIIGAEAGQYTFASESKAQTVKNVMKSGSVGWADGYVPDYELTVPEDYPYDEFTLSGGMIHLTAYGNPYGDHRKVTYNSPVVKNTDARIAYMGQLPEIKIPVAVKNAELESISLDTENFKTSYYVGDTVDTENLVVTANYDNGQTQIAKNYTVSPSVITADTNEITVTYKGKTATIPVTATVAKVKEIKITKQPKTTYTEGQTFTPSGMVITAVYENGTEMATSEYTYSPNRELKKDDTEIVITYTGSDKFENLSTVSIPITVNEKSSAGSSSSGKVSVYFTLLGDEKHGNSGETHTKADGNLETWIPRTKVTVDKGSYLIDVIEKVLSLNGMPYENLGNYISGIKGLYEFNNGDMSGWMYLINGRYSLYGVNEQVVRNGDEIVFHYTDDYSKERDEKKKGGSSSGTTNTENKQEQTDDAVKSDETNKSDDVTVDEPVVENSYNDVKENEWFSEAVSFVSKHNYMTGVSDDEFMPEGNLTRAMLVTILYRMENEPETVLSQFEDVSENAWYSKAIGWASENNIVSGVGDNKFAPDENITREQIATILMRYIEKYQGVENTVEDNTLAEMYEDGKDISSYALKAIAFMNKNGVINGRTDTTLNPKDTATRAETAMIITVMFEKNLLVFE